MSKISKERWKDPKFREFYNIMMADLWEKYQEIKTKFGVPQEGDILLTSVGTLGIPYCIGVNERFYFKDGNLTWFKDYEHNLNNRFLLYWLRSPLAKRQIEMIAIGSTQRALTIDALKKMVICTPKYDEQCRIVKIISDLDSKIGLNLDMNKTLEAIGHAFFKHWFVDFEFPSDEGKPYKSSGGEMVNSELGEIPKGWKIGELTEFLDFLEGPGIRNWQYTLGGTRFINIRLIRNNDIDIANANYVSNEEAYGKYKHFLLEEKDMIVSTSGTLGRTAIVRKKHLPLMLNTSVIRFRPIDAESYPFMYQYLNSSLFYNELKSLASGSVQLNFGPMHLKSMKMLMPTKEILNLYNKSVSCVYDKIVSNLDKSDILSHLRDSLLPRLMSGRIRVGMNL